MSIGDDHCAPAFKAHPAGELSPAEQLPPGRCAEIHLDVAIVVVEVGQAKKAHILAPDLLGPLVGMVIAAVANLG